MLFSRLDHYKSCNRVSVLYFPMSASARTDIFKQSLLFQLLDMIPDAVFRYFNHPRDGFHRDLWVFSDDRQNPVLYI